MSSINGLGNNPSVQRILNNPIQKEIPATDSTQPTKPISDRLELSGMSHLMKSLKADGGVRADKVASIRAQIEAGTYEDESKLDGAVDKLLGEITE